MDGGLEAPLRPPASPLVPGSVLIHHLLGPPTAPGGRKIVFRVRCAAASERSEGFPGLTEQVGSQFKTSLPALLSALHPADRPWNAGG